MENLIPEITIDIISRLPLESVLDCRRVSKTWRDVISQLSFARLHLLRSSHSFSQQQLNDDDDDDGEDTKTLISSAADSSSKVSFITLIRFNESENDKCDPECLLFYGEYDGHHIENENENENLGTDEIYFLKEESWTKQLTKTRINHPLFSNDTKLVGSCNGLICVTAWNRGLDDPVYICNPITREYIDLPRFSLKKRWWDGVLVSGFGYHPRTNEYKVVRIYYDFDDKPVVGWVQVYTLGSGSGWRDKGETKCRFHKRATIANGALHWWDYAEKRYVSFDLADEEFHLLPSLPCDDGQHDIRALGGLLCFFHQKEGECVKVWSLKKMKKSRGNYNMKKEHDYYESWSWSLEFSIQCEHIFRTNFTEAYAPFALTKSGEILLWDFYSVFYRYNLKIATFERLKNYASRDARQIINVIPHINSFISLKALGEDAKII